MIAFWVIAGTLVALTVGLLVRALSRERAGGPADNDLEVYRDQLRELERDRANGAIGAEEAEAARTEIERRVLAAADADRTRTDPRPSPRLAFALALALPAAALVLYLQVGTPGLPDQPRAERQTAAGPSAERIAELEARAEAAPEDAGEWIALARAYRSARRFRDAADAFARAVGLGAAGQNAALGEALTMAAGGTVTREAQAAFEAARETGIDDPRVPFYLGLARAQQGDPEGALDQWLPLEARTPPDAAWLSALRERIAEAASDAGLSEEDLAARRAELAADRPGPTREQMEAAGAMSEAERGAMIEDMVARLAARLEENPDDLEGWRRLGRSYMVLDRPSDARDAYARAAELAPDNVTVLVDYGEAMLAAHEGEGTFPEPFVPLMRRILSLDPENPVALWFVGVAEMRAGNPETAREHWSRLLDRLPPDAPQRAELERRIEALEQQDGG